MSSQSLRCNLKDVWLKSYLLFKRNYILLVLSLGLTTEQTLNLSAEFENKNIHWLTDRMNYFTQLAN